MLKSKLYILIILSGFWACSSSASNEVSNKNADTNTVNIHAVISTDAQNQNDGDTERERKSAVTQQKKVTADTSNWRTYKSEEYKFSFQYPKGWQLVGNIAKSVNLQGKVTNISITFTSKDLRIILQYFLPPNGSKIYQYSLSQFKDSKGNFKSNKKKITVAGNDGLMANYTNKRNGKGQLMKSPFKNISVEFLDKEKTGEFKLQLQTKQDQVADLEDFRKVLSSFRFL